MKKKIAITDICIGMYIHSVDRSWFDTSLFRHRFLVKRQAQIDKLVKSDIQHVVIDTDRGCDLKSQLPSATASTTAAKANTNTKSSNTTTAPLALQWIDKHLIMPDTNLNFTVYTHDNHCLVPANTSASESILIPAQDFYIATNDLEKYKYYLNDITRPAVMQQSNPELKNRLIRENTTIVMHNLFNDSANSENIKQCEQGVQEIIAAIFDSDSLVSNLLAINQIDSYIYTHSVNVAVMSVALAMDAKMNDNDLHMIGLGCLLHDIGKSTISKSILNKPINELTKIETSLLQQHVFDGRDLLKLYPGIPDAVSLPVIQHHETLSGTGYPQGLKGDDLHPFSRITAITNLYDNLTSEHPQQDRLKPFAALNHIRDRTHDYDIRFFKHFVKIVGRFR